MKAKHIICMALFFLIACNKKQVTDKHLQVIEKDINAQALGMDIGYKAGDFDTLLVLTSAAAIKDLSQQLEMDLTTEMPSAIEKFTKVYENHRMDDESGTFLLWKYEVDHMKRLQTAKPEDIDLSVYKYRYTVKNIFNPSGERTELENYYFFDYNDSLLGHVDKAQLKSIKSKFVRSEYQPYDMVRAILITGIETP